jgi:hypothetical protein
MSAMTPAHQVETAEESSMQDKGRTEDEAQTSEQHRLVSFFETVRTDGRHMRRLQESVAGCSSSVPAHCAAGSCTRSPASCSSYRLSA